MNNMATLMFYTILFLTNCVPNRPKEQKQKDKVNRDYLEQDSTALPTGWYYVVDSSNNYKRQLDKSNEVYFLNPKPIVTAKNVKESEIRENWLGNKKYFWLTMRLDKEGTENWSYATRASIRKKLAFIIDNRLLQVVTVNSEMTDGVAVFARDGFTRKEVVDFKAMLESGR